VSGERAASLHHRRHGDFARTPACGEQLGIVKGLTAQKRNRLFSYADYIEIMNRGAELPSR